METHLGELPPLLLYGYYDTSHSVLIHRTILALAANDTYRERYDFLRIRVQYITFPNASLLYKINIFPKAFHLRHGLFRGGRWMAGCARYTCVLVARDVVQEVFHITGEW